MRTLKKIWNFLGWLEQEKINTMIYCGRPTSI
jgi:hypothetical protein